MILGCFTALNQAMLRKKAIYQMGLYMKLYYNFYMEIILMKQHSVNTTIGKKGRKIQIDIDGVLPSILKILI